MKSGRMLTIAMAMAMVVGAAPAGKAFAQPTKMPAMVIMASYETGAGIYTWGVALSGAIEKQTRAKVRIIPTMTDAGKALLLRSKEAHYTLLGGGTAWFIASGLVEFDAPEWGPQPLRVLWVGSTSAIGFMTRADAGIKTIGDLKGKRVYYVPGAHGPNSYNEAYLAFAGLTWADVQKVTLPSYGSALKAINDGAVDAGAASVLSPGARELEAGPRGLHWLPVPFRDKEGWSRLQKVAPYFFPGVATTGAGVSQDKPLEVAHYSTFVLAYDWLDDGVAFNITKSLVDGFDTYKGVSPQLGTWTMDTFVKYLPNAFMPLHAGAIRYLKEAGKWNADLERWQASQLQAAAQRVQAWKTKYRLD